MAGNAPRHPSGDDAFIDWDDEPTQERMRGGVRTPRNITTDQRKVRRRQRTAADEHNVTCPNCHRQVSVELEHEDGKTVIRCPNCGYHGPLSGGSKEGSRMTQDNGHSTEGAVATLLREAAKAPTLADAQRLVGEAERMRSEETLSVQASRQLDLAGAEVRDTLTPSPVHELHTAATDWIADEHTAAPENARQAMIATATSWYGELHPAVAADGSEFRIQAEGMAERECGAFGEASGIARQAFLSTAATLRQRDVGTGRIVEAQVVGGEVAPQGAADVLGQNPPTGGDYQGLPGDQTDSNRAPAFADMGGSVSSPSSPNDPGEGTGTGNGAAEVNNGEGPVSSDPYKAASRRTANGGSMPEELKKKIKDESDGDPDAPEPERDQKEGSMQRSAIGEHVATCPSCQGFGGVARTEQGRRFIAALRRQGASTVHQIEEIADPFDQPSQTPMPEQQAFPMEEGGWNPANSPESTDIPQAEQQINQREQLKGAARVEQLARQAAQEAYRQVRAAHSPANVWEMFNRTALMQDDSGWLGDNGAGGQQPGQQAGPPPGGNNLGMPDPVYGEGGDQSPGQRRPFGNDETSDRTNAPDNWQTGQPAQADVAGRGESLDSGAAPAFPDDGYTTPGDPPQMSRSSSFDQDPRVRRAQAFLREVAQEYSGR